MFPCLYWESIRKQFDSEFEGIKETRITIPSDLAQVYADMLNVKSIGTPAGSQLYCNRPSSMVSIDVNREMFASLFFEETKRQLTRRVGASSRSCKGSDLSLCYDMEEKLKAKRNRNGRKSDAMRLPRPLIHGFNSGLNQKITCIWSGGAYSWMEALSGISWVAVYGMDSICVAARIKDLELEFSLRVAMLNFEPEHLLHIFTHGLIGKVEDFADPSCLQYQLIHPIIKKPFGVVSVIPDTKIVRTISGHKAISDEYDEGNAIKFLKKEMESGMTFTLDETIQTAICALDHLFHEKFKAKEIMVFVWKKDMGGGEAKALPHIREELDISEHLAAINNPDNGVSSSVVS